METGNLYICKKPYAVDEARINPSEDKEHWGIYLPRGEKGYTGEQGLQGEKGEKGDKGDKGDTGPQGIRGIKGDVGPRGNKWFTVNAYVPVSGSTGTILQTAAPDAKIGDYVISTYENSYGNFAVVESENIGDISTLTLRGNGNLKGEKGDSGATTYLTFSCAVRGEGRSLNSILTSHLYTVVYGNPALLKRVAVYAETERSFYFHTGSSGNMREVKKFEGVLTVEGALVYIDNLIYIDSRNAALSIYEEPGHFDIEGVMILGKNDLSRVTVEVMYSPVKPII